MFFRAMEKGKDRKEEAESGEREGREKAREAAAKPRRISGVGDEASWDGSTLGSGLFVLKGDVHFRLSVGGFDNEAVKIEKLKKLARRAVHRLFGETQP